MEIPQKIYCAICQTKRFFTAEFDKQEQADGTFIDANVIKLTCEKSTDEVEHAIRMSGQVTKEEVAKILADNERDFKKIAADEAAAPVETKTDEQKLTELFN